MNEEKKLTQKFNDQFPNDQLMWHIDNLPGNPRSERVLDNPDFKYQEPDKIRFLIMLEDWEPDRLYNLVIKFTHSGELVWLFVGSGQHYRI